MLHKLDPEQYELVRPLYTELRDNLVVDSIIDGNTQAWVYADSDENPRVALMWNCLDALLVAGDARSAELVQAVGQRIVDEIVPNARRRGIPQLMLQYDSQLWEEVVDRLLPNLPYEMATRRFYQPGPLQVDWREQMPDWCVMLPMDKGLLQQADRLKGREMVGWVRSFWRSFDDFVETGFGYCLLQGDVVASWCLSVYASGNDYELGVATALDFRRRGYAILTTAACVEHCQERGFTPHWHCWNDNLPSIAVAERVGFVDPTEYTVYRIDLVT